MVWTVSLPSHRKKGRDAAGRGCRRNAWVAIPADGMDEARGSGGLSKNGCYPIVRDIVGEVAGRLACESNRVCSVTTSLERSFNKCITIRGSVRAEVLLSCRTG